MRDPLVMHYDRGTNCHVLLRVEIVMTSSDFEKTCVHPPRWCSALNFPLALHTNHKLPTTPSLPFDRIDSESSSRCVHANRRWQTFGYGRMASGAARLSSTLMLEDLLNENAGG